MNNPLSKKFSPSSLLKFTLPGMVMMIFTSIYSMLAGIFSSTYIDTGTSHDAFNSIILIQPISTIVIAIAVMFATGSNAIIAKNMGENKTKTAKENFTVITILGVLIGIIITAICFIFDDQLIKLLGGSGDGLISKSKLYLHIISLSFPFVFLQILGQYYFVTVGKQILGLISFVLGGVANILINIIFIKVINTGMYGPGAATTAGFVIPGIIFIIFFAIKRDSPLHFIKPKLHPRYIRDTCTNGSSEMVGNLAVALIAILFNIIMIKLKGDDGLAAVGVISQVKFMLNSLYIGFGSGVAPIFAYAYGKGEHKQIRNVFNISIKFVLISSAVLVALSLALSKFIVGLFIESDGTAFNLALTGFRIFSVGYLFAGFNIFTSVFFTSVSNGPLSALVSLLRTFVFVAGMLLILPNIIGVTGVWLAIPIAEALASGVCIFLIDKKKNIYLY